MVTTDENERVISEHDGDYPSYLTVIHYDDYVRLARFFRCNEQCDFVTFSYDDIPKLIETLKDFYEKR